MHCADTAHMLHALRPHRYCARIPAVPTHCARPAHIAHAALLVQTLSCAHCTLTAHSLHTYAVPCMLQVQTLRCACCTHGTRTLHPGHCALHLHCTHCTWWVCSTNCPAHAHPHCAHASHIPPHTQSTAGVPSRSPPCAPRCTPRAPWAPARAGRPHTAHIPVPAQAHACCRRAARAHAAHCAHRHSLRAPCTDTSRIHRLSSTQHPPHCMPPSQDSHLFPHGIN